MAYINQKNKMFEKDQVLFVPFRVLLRIKLVYWAHNIYDLIITLI